MGSIDACDVAIYILEKQGPLSAMKLQKLVYYSQAWSLVWDDKPLFDNKIEAWTNGPIVKDLYDKHKGQYLVSAQDLKTNISGPLTEEQKETIDVVLEAYGDKSAQWLSDQTHLEAPWLEARQGLSDADRGAREITLASMAEYYSSL